MLVVASGVAWGVSPSVLSAQAGAPASSAASWEPARTPWGVPDLQGAYTNSDESLTPFERPDEFEGRSLEEFTEAELAELRESRSEARKDADRRRWQLRSPLHWFENHEPQNSRAWLVVDPPDGKVPPPTEEARQRAQQRGGGVSTNANPNGPFDGPEDFGLYDRCITRGLPGSMMPAIYGSSYQIVQGPSHVAITYEMVHETRIIPVSDAPHVGAAIRQYMGDARGRWEGNTLVVGTGNFTELTPYRGSSAALRIVERFTPTGPDTVEWAVTLEDPHTWSRPWTFAMNLTRKDDSQQPFEYACHEGNYGLQNMLTVSRSEDENAR